MSLWLSVKLVHEAATRTRPVESDGSVGRLEERSRNAVLAVSSDNARRGAILRSRTCGASVTNSSGATLHSCALPMHATMATASHALVSLAPESRRPSTTVPATGSAWSISSVLDTTRSASFQPLLSKSVQRVTVTTAVESVVVAAISSETTSERG
eukprot:scaffold133332_cov78-Phaeocystis_antarctica.AAC.4